MLLSIMAKCVTVEVALTVVFFVFDAIIRRAWRRVEKQPEIES